MEAVRHSEAIERRSRPTAGIIRGTIGRLPSPAAGAAASAAMALFYVIVVVGASGSVDHLTDQVGADWYLLLPIVAGFGVQVGLLVELRRRQRMNREVAAAGAAGAGASTVGMVACCAHHIADLLPLVGATAAATFLYDYRLPFMLVGVGLNAIAITVAIRRLRKTPALHDMTPAHHPTQEDEHACALDGSSR
jgi:hypothetical protein